MGKENKAKKGRGAGVCGGYPLFLALLAVFSASPARADVAVQAPVKEAVQPAEKTYSCDFASSVGSKVTPELLDAIGREGRPHRILPPGAGATRDHNPARVNFDVDGEGTITRIWCA
jgi:hypothetical protein